MNYAGSRDSVLRTLIRFSIPFLISYFLQTLYGLADLFVIGQFCAVSDTTAVSVSSQIMHMLTVMIVGLSMGSTVMIGHAVGAKRPKDVSQTIGTTILLFGGLSVILAVVLNFSISGILKLVALPEAAVPEAVSYLRICFIGIPCITAYNIISSVYRGLGDSRTPMYFVAAACVCNILLDYLLIGGLGLGAAGAALGTTLSQLFSVILGLCFIRKTGRAPELTKADLRVCAPVLRQLLSIGVPVALQDGLIQVSFMVITVIVNLRGLNDAAAVGIVEKLISFLFLVPSSLLSSVSALAAQDLGAGRPDRAGQTLRYSIYIGILYGLLIGFIMQFAAERFIGLFTQDSSVIGMGAQYMHSYILDCMFAGIHFSFSGYFCACERSRYSFLHNIISILCVRIPLAWFFSSHFPDTLFPLGFASTLGSVLSVLICAYLFLRLRRQFGRRPE